MNAYVGLVVSNLRILFRSRELLFWDLAFPVLLMVLLGAAFGHAGFNATVGVSGSGPVGPALVHALQHVPGITVDRVLHGRNLLGTGHLDVWVSILNQHVLVTRTGSPTSAIAANVVQGIVNQLTIALMHQTPPITLKMSTVAGPSGSYVDFLVPGIIAMSLMTSGLFAGGALAAYRSQGILRRISATPLSSLQFLLARYTSQLVLAALETVILLAAAHLLYGFNLSGSVPAFIVLLFLGSTAFLMMGFFVANIVDSPEVVSTINNVINLPMMFLSGIFYAVGQLPQILRPLSSILPLKYLAAALRGVSLSGQPLAAQGLAIAVLVGTTVVFGGLAASLFKWDARRV
jgi:ABC-2 type transport system permease protein